MDRLEGALRRVVALAWLTLSAMAVQGAWRGRTASGRVEGRPFSTLPLWFFAALLPPYLALVVRLWRPLPLRLSPAGRVGASLTGAALALAGLSLTVWGRVALGRMYNVSSTLGARLYAEHKLITTGPFALVRHPMYLGVLVAGIGNVLLYRTWTTVVILAHEVVFCVRAGREEAVLAAEFGKAWQAYTRRVPAGIPVLGALNPQPVATSTA